MIEVYMDSVRKYRNKSEYRLQNRAVCMGKEYVSDGETIKPLLASILADNPSLTGSDVYIYRGATLVFNPMPIDEWASGRALRGEQPEHLKRSKPDE